MSEAFGAARTLSVQCVQCNFCAEQTRGNREVGAWLDKAVGRLGGVWGPKYWSLRGWWVGWGPGGTEWPSHCEEGRLSVVRSPEAWLIRVKEVIFWKIGGQLDIDCTYQGFREEWEEELQVCSFGCQLSLGWVSLGVALLWLSWKELEAEVREELIRVVRTGKMSWEMFWRRGKGIGSREWVLG